MKIVKPSAELLFITPNAEQLIERCGRICYKSEDKITSDSAAKFIRMVIENGHHAVIEHAYATIIFVCCRGVTHEQVRHRIASYCQESTRFCNYSKDKFGNEISVIEPPGLDEINRYRWEEVCIHIEKAYMKMIEDGIPPQIARTVLPTCLKTEIAVTANLREWRHILNLRWRNDRAHPQIREVMGIAAKFLNDHCPNVFPSNEYLSCFIT